MCVCDTYSSGHVFFSLSNLLFIKQQFLQTILQVSTFCPPLSKLVVFVFLVWPAQPSVFHTERLELDVVIRNLPAQSALAQANVLPDP